MKKEEAKIKKESLLKEIESLDKIINAPDITAEQRLLEMFHDCVIDTKNIKGAVLFMKGVEWHFQIRKDTISCRNKYVWDVLKQEYSLNNKEIQALIQKVLEEAFKINWLTPRQAEADAILNWKKLSK